VTDLLVQLVDRRVTVMRRGGPVPTLHFLSLMEQLLRFALKMFSLSSQIVGTGAISGSGVSSEHNSRNCGSQGR
jgi:hypothetical protein